MIRRRSRTGFALAALGLSALACRATFDPRAPVPRPFDLQGHRGARALFPENSLPAFERALELGVSTLEMDAVVTADDRVVVSHDPWMSSTICSHPDGRPVGEEEARSLAIRSMTYAEVAQYDCGSRGHPDFPRQVPRPVSKPLLEDVIRFAEAWTAKRHLPAVAYDVEVKSRPEWDGVLHPSVDDFVRLVREVFVRTGVTHRATLQSFDRRALREAREQDPDLRLSLLVDREGSRGLAADVAALGFEPEVYSPEHVLVDAAMIAEARERGIAVIPWTVNDEAEVRRLVALGVDGLITDDPSIGRELTLRRSEAP